MFDFSKLGDMATLGKDIQARQEQFQKEQLELLQNISRQVAEIIALLKEKQ